jgi:DMSO/TMAO reductase YedYZ heme-binding membrane subunit
MLVKSWPAEPLVYAALVAVLLLFRAADRLPGVTQKRQRVRAPA